MVFSNWKRSEQVSMVATLVFALASGIFAFLPTTIFIQAIAAGALGGLFHEISQSGGRIFFIQKREDGLYLGSLTGMVLGSVAGLMLLQGFLPSARICDTNATGTPETECVEFGGKTRNAANVRLILEIFLAGMALKGVAEAATGQEVPSTPLQPVADEQPFNPPLQPVADEQPPDPPANPANASRVLRPRPNDSDAP